MRNATHTIAIKTAKNALNWCLLVAGFVIVAAYMPVDMSYADPAPANPIVHGESPSERLFNEAGCWTGHMAPKVEGIPPHVLISTPGSGPRLAGSRMVGKALEQIFEGKDYGLTVHGFCR